MTDPTTIDLLCQRMIEDMTAAHARAGLAEEPLRKRAYKRFTAWLETLPHTATADDIRLFRPISPRPVLAPLRATPP